MQTASNHDGDEMIGSAMRMARRAPQACLRSRGVASWVNNVEHWIGPSWGHAPTPANELYTRLCDVVARYRAVGL